MSLLEEGQVIRETYEVERFLGQGAFAEVYRVKHRFLGRQAMKVFKRVGMSLDEIHDMLGEAILLSRIAHPNIVKVFDANVLETPKGTCGYFTMEHVSGGSLDKFWRSFGSSFIPVETTVDLVKQVCRGLGQAHQEKPPIIHRDIKPQNILVGYEPDGFRARVSRLRSRQESQPSDPAGDCRRHARLQTARGVRSTQRRFACCGRVGHRRDPLPAAHRPPACGDARRDDLEHQASV